MDGVTSAVTQMIILLAIAAAGYGSAKRGMLDEHTNQKLTKLLMNVTLPCMMLASVYGLDASEAGILVPWAFALATAQFFLMLLCGVVIVFVLRVPKADRKYYLFMAVATNNGFIGIPVTAAILGAPSVIFASIFVMVANVFLFSVGFAILASGTGEKFAIPWKAIASPSMFASLAALGLFFAGIQLPGVVQESLELLGGITSPVSMLVVGSIMAQTNFKDIVGELRLYPFIILKQLIAPALLFAAYTALGLNPLLIGVFTIMFAMPVGAMTPTFVEQFNGNATLAAKGTVLTTLGSFVVLPVLLALLPVI